MYNPALHISINKALAASGIPLDSRSYFYDEDYFVYRPYASEAEVLAYLIGHQRQGHFSIVINTGGTVAEGVVTGGENVEWWFKDGIADTDLVEKGGGASKTIVTKTGGDIVNGNINTSGDSIPADSDIIASYADGEPILSPIFYSETQNLIYGLSGNEGATTLTFKFI